MMSTNPTNQIPKPYSHFECDNFTGMQQLTLRAAQPSVFCPALVQLNQSTGSFNFQFSLLPHQARELAAVLMILADTVEVMDAEAAIRDEVAAEKAAA